MGPSRAEALRLASRFFPAFLGALSRASEVFGDTPGAKKLVIFSGMIDRPGIRSSNVSLKDVTVLIERIAGNENAATASMVIAMSEFRSLFSEEVLSPETPISVGAVALRR